MANDGDAKASLQQPKSPIPLQSPSMVRLVIRPYTPVWRSICTSGSLQSSTRVSSGFNLPRHSSPSFGYQSSISLLRSATTTSKLPCGQAHVANAGCCGPHDHMILFLYAFNQVVETTSSGLFKTDRPDALLDSLVRVSRRVVRKADLLTANLWQTIL